MKNIITEYDQLVKIVEGLRAEKKKIVLTQGTFDLVHIGHGRYLEKAKSFGDVLIVGVDSDEKVRQRKGPDRPVVPENERAEMLTYFTSVDYVVIKGADEKKFSLARRVRPDVLIVTEETHHRYTAEHLAELKKLCGKIVVLEAQATTSTSAKIRLLQIGAARKISTVLNEKLVKTIEEVLKELKGQE